MLKRVGLKTYLFLSASLATFGTLVLVPAVLSLVLDLRARVARTVPGGVALPVPATAREP